VTWRGGNGAIATTEPASRNNRLRIIEGGELKHLLAEYLDLDVRIDLARRPRRTT